MEITEVIEDFGGNFKSNMKKPWFKWALVGVVAVALYVAWRNSKTTDSSGVLEETGEYYIPTGYASGYPEMSGGSAGNTDMEILYDNMDELYSEVSKIEESSNNTLQSLQEQLTDMQTSFDASNSALTDQIEKLNANAQKQADSQAAMEEELRKQSVIAEMMTNSKLYGVSDNDDDREALHDRNVVLGSSIGATYNPATGVWSDGLTGDNLYNDAMQNTQYITTVDRLGREEVVEAVNTDTHVIRKTTSKTVTNPDGTTRKKYNTSVDTNAYTKRDTSNAGKTVYKNGYNVTYNENGYATKMVKVNQK